MNTASHFQKNLVIFGIPLLLFGMMVLLSRSPFFATNPDNLSVGITIDLLLTIPLVYFLLIRNTDIPKITVIPFLIAGMVVGSVILPAPHQYYLGLFRTWVLPLVELFVLTFIILKVRQAIKGYKTHQDPSIDFFTTLKATCNDMLPKMAVVPVVTEISVFYYGFLHWKKRKLNDNEFSYHRESGSVSLLVAIILIVTIETYAFHVLLMKWSEAAAWVLTFLSVYSGLQLFGFLRSMFKRPIAIGENRLYLRYGIVNETTIDLAKIEEVQISSRDIDFDQETRSFSFLGKLESHNVIIRLKEPHTLYGLYGIKRTYTNLALHVDDKTRFAEKIHDAIQQLP